MCLACITQAGCTVAKKAHDTSAAGLSQRSICEDLFLKRHAVLYPVPRLYPGGVFDPFWEDNEALFFFRFRFRRLHFQRTIYAMELSDKSFKCGIGKRFHWYPADLCIMVLLRRLAYPCRFFYLVEIFGIESNRLCEMYHAAVEFIYSKYSKLCDPQTWTRFFSNFADLMHKYGCPYRNNVGLLDGTFTRSCRAGGLGNKTANKRMDQSQFYNGAKAAHGYQSLGVFFPNGMIAIADPCYGKVHDSALLRASGWIDILQAALAADGRVYQVFGDAAFALHPCVQAMVKGILAVDDQSFNALMSRIRIHIENAFGGQSNQFAFLSFYRSNKIGGRNCAEQFMVAAIFMNMRCTFYGNQFTHELNNGMRMSLEEILDLVK